MSTGTTALEGKSLGLGQSNPEILLLENNFKEIKSRWVFHLKDV